MGRVRRTVSVCVVCLALLFVSACASDKGAANESGVSGVGENAGMSGTAGAVGADGAVSGAEESDMGSTAGTESGAGAEPEAGAASGAEAEGDVSESGTDGAADAGALSGTGDAAGADAERAAALRAEFGEDCIPEQTFEVELSEYEGSVWFVPFAPDETGAGFHMQIVQNGEVLQDMHEETLGTYFGKGLESLDAVSFYDVNYDGETDILLIGTKGGNAVASVYYGEAANEYSSAYFWYQEALSENLTRQAAEVSVTGIRALLSEGKRNGSFSGYQEAYRAASRLYELEGKDRVGFDLIYVDGDEVPELLAGEQGYYVSLYMYRDGMLYQPIEEWYYGAMGNAGYEYSPYQNSLRNYNADFAGAIMYTTYMTLGPSCSVDTVAEIETVNFDDANGNGMLDEEEEDSAGKYGVTYVNGVQVSAEEAADDPYDVGGYVYMDPCMDRETLLSQLK